MNIAFRTDASVQIGTGHVMRCLTLANALVERGGKCHFIIRKNADALLELIRGHGHKIHLLRESTIVNKNTTAHAGWLEGDWRCDAEETRDILTHIHAAWLIVDHYALDAAWEKIVKAKGIRLMVIDDLADRPHLCDVLLDQNLGHTALDYTPFVPKECRILMGPRFALVRPEFPAKRATLKQLPGGKNSWLACVGGLDPHNILEKIVSAWEGLHGSKPSLTLAVSAGSPNVESLKRQIVDLRDVTLHVQNPHMADLMAGAELFIGTTGGVSWERCCLGLPAVMGAVAENQCSNLEALTRQGTGVNVGDWRTISIEALREEFELILRQPELLSKMAAESAKLVDGNGTLRVATALMLKAVMLRKATPTDAKEVLQWRNDEITRRYSFDSNIIPLETHEAWWKKSIEMGDRSLLMAHVNEKPVGVLQLDHAQEDRVVSLYIDPDLSGFGLGTAILEAGINWSRMNDPETTRFLADIKPENKASQAAFQKAGFVFQNSKWVYVL